MNPGKLIWFVVGASIGTALALLYAPQSGQDTRDYLGKQARRGRDSLAKSGRDAFETGRDLLERGRALAGEAAEIIDRGRA